MAWSGYFEFDGNEVINVSRAEAYAQNMGLTWLKPTVRNADLPLMLGQTYTVPKMDDAPWLDPDLVASMEFMGVYPLSVSGIEDSTIEAAVTESILDGGVVSRPRQATRTVVFSCALLGTREAGVEYGLRWLRTVLAGAPCDGQKDCVGSNLCYLAYEPYLNPLGDSDTLTDCLTPLLRNLQKVSLTTGPTVTGKFNPQSGGVVWTVTFTLVAGTPYEFTQEVALIEGFTDGATDVYVDDIYYGLPVDTDGVPAVEAACSEPVYRPLFDPTCPLVVAPPSVPAIPVSCFAFPETFVRRYFTVPQELIPLFGTAVPILTIVTGNTETRSLRLRYYADVMQTGDPDNDPCAYCGDIVISYLPAGSTFVMDGTTRQVQLRTPGMPYRRADAVVFKSNGTPFEWPELTCGFSYLTVVDLPDTQVMPSISMSLVGKVG